MRGYVDTSVGQVHYRHEGDAGPHVVLLHCANFSSNLYERTLPYFGKRTQAWAFDAPGVGLSDAPHAPTIPQIAPWLLEACDALGVERPVVAGLHTGCRIALQMVKERGAESFAGLVLMGIGPLSKEFEAEHPVRGPHLLIEPDKQGTQWHQAIERYRFIYPDQNPPTEKDAWVQHLFALSSTNKIVPMRLPWPAAPPEGWELGTTFKEFPNPIFVYNTPEDLFCETDEIQATWNPNAELKVVKGVGPHLMLREPETYANDFLSFMERNGLL